MVVMVVMVMDGGGGDGEEESIFFRCQELKCRILGGWDDDIIANTKSMILIIVRRHGSLSRYTTRPPPPHATPPPTQSTDSFWKAVEKLKNLGTTSTIFNTYTYVYCTIYLWTILYIFGIELIDDIRPLQSGNLVNARDASWHWLPLIAGIQYVSKRLNSKRTGHIIQEDQRLVDACQEWRMVTYYCTALQNKNRMEAVSVLYYTRIIGLDWIGLDWILLLCRFSVVYRMMHPRLVMYRGTFT